MTGEILDFVETDKPLAAVREALLRACAAHKFGVLGAHDLREKMREKGVEFDGECVVFEVCNPHQAKRVLEAAPDIATALPCRIAAYRTREGRTRIATIRPTALLGLFKAAGLEPVAAEVESTLGAILRESA